MQASVRESGTVLIWAPLRFATASLGAAQALHRVAACLQSAQEDVFAGRLVSGWGEAAQRDWGALAGLLLSRALGCQGLPALRWVAVEGTGHFFHLCSSWVALSASHQHGTFLALHTLRSFSLLCRTKSIPGLEQAVLFHWKGTVASVCSLSAWRNAQWRS